MSSPSDRTPESVYASWLAARELGEACDFDALLSDHPEVADELRALHARRADSTAVGAGAGAGSEGEQAAWTEEVLRRLSLRGSAGPRYRTKEEVGRGGMGTVLRVWDDDLKRSLAMKVMLDPARGGERGPLMLARFLEEAQVTGQLDHPGIVPVHEVGLDEEGRVFFTMKLVKGRDLEHILELVREGREGWTRVRALGVLLRVCEAMAYAHDKGVIHRDLKPANIMVGRFGAVYVMDWGQARVLGSDEPVQEPAPDHDPASDTHSVLRTERSLRGSDSTESPFVSVDGEVFGTPAYMPPEQAMGQVAQMGPQADVYAVGAMLYHLLAGHAPYLERGSRLPNALLLLRVIEGPPQPLSAAASDDPGELTSICEKAMARAPAERYANMSELAADLSAYLEGRVVSAYEAGSWAVARKWLRRNRLLAASMAGAVVLLVAGLVSSLVLKARSDENAMRADLEAEKADRNAREAELHLARSLENERRANENLLLARRNEDEARAEAAKVRSLSDGVRLAQVEQSSWSMPLASRGDLQRFERELAVAESLLTRLPQHEDQLQLLNSIEPDRRVLAPETRAPGDVDTEASRTLDEVEFLRKETRRTVERLRLLELDDPRVSALARMRLRLEIALSSIDSMEARSRWSAARASIRANPAYDGLELPPQFGLIPIGADPGSGLWLFLHVESGGMPPPRTRPVLEVSQITRSTPSLPAPPRPREGTNGEPGPDGEAGLWHSPKVPDQGLNASPAVPVTEAPSPVQATRTEPGLRVDLSTGIVLVLVPGGTTLVGGEELRVEPFFASIYEMNQAQWARVAHAPSGEHVSPSPLPMGSISWVEAHDTLKRLGLELPTRAQWLRLAADHAELVALRAPQLLAQEGVKKVPLLAHWWFPGWFVVEFGKLGHLNAEDPTPVGSRACNSLGVYDCLGNLSEWCQEEHRNGLGRVSCGGAFGDSVQMLLENLEAALPEGDRSDSQGVRPVRPIVHD